MSTTSPTPTFALTNAASPWKMPRRVPKVGGAFKRETINQLDFVRGTPELQVPAGHLARKVWALVETLDLGQFGVRRSGLGRRALDPRNVLAVLLYASIVGIHLMTAVSRATVTDAAFRLLSGGHVISASKLCTFRREGGALFDSVLTQTVKAGLEAGFVGTDNLSTDGMRLRANASMKALRTVERSTKRLVELAKVGSDTMSPEEKTAHDAKVVKHETALEFLHKEDRTSYCVTNEDASLMKFPTGGSQPGHRILATVSGVRERMVVGLVVNKSPTDFGQLEGAVEQARTRMTAAGMAEGTKLVVSVDAGFLSEDDQLYMVKQRETTDIIAPPHTEGVRMNGDIVMFKREEFRRDEDGRFVCPAGTPMKSPADLSKRKQVWQGVGCDECPLRARCTTGKQSRKFEIDTVLEGLHAKVKQRFEAPGAKERYKQRMCCVEPLFSVLQEAMRFRRASSRKGKTVVAESYLKFGAYNIHRLILLTDAKRAAETPPPPKRRDYRRNPEARARLLRPGATSVLAVAASPPT